MARATALFWTDRAPARAAQTRDLVRAAARLVDELTFDSWGVLAPGLSGVRGGLGARQLVWMSGDIEVKLQISPAQAEGPGTLLGQVAGSEPETASVALVDEAGAATARADADPYGMFELAAPAGRYDLTVTLADAVLVLPGLVVG